MDRLRLLLGARLLEHWPAAIVVRPARRPDSLAPRWLSPLLAPPVSPSENVAAAAFRRTLAMAEKLYGVDHPVLIDALVGLSEALAAVGDGPGARATAERAVTASRTTPADIQGRVQFRLARAQWSAGDPTAAVASARGARAKLASLSFASPELSGIDRWLATRR
jgi:hypothetical protein